MVLGYRTLRGEDVMKEKEFTGLLGATAVTCLRLTKAWKGTGRVVIGDI